ncbi:MAG TPA: hypothetical protein ENK54_05815 [Thiotrichales bacterium]|nr:hypothetical protein [Thiotrichales bacterium]
MSEQDQEKKEAPAERSDPERPEPPPPEGAGEEERTAEEGEERSPSPPPEREAASPPPSAGPTPSGRAPLLLLTLGLLLMAGGAGYLAWSDRQQGRALDGIEGRLAALEGSIRQESGRIDGLQATLEESRRGNLSRLEALEQRLSALVTAHTTLEQAVVALGRKNQAAEGDWSLAEVEYLLLVANRRLQLARDVETAIRALLDADRRLRDMADPKLLTVRNAIAKALTRLRAVPRVDVSGLALELENLARQAAGLTPRSAQPRALLERLSRTEESAAPPDEGSAVEPEKSLAGLWEQLRSLVVIRRHDQPITPMLAPEQMELVRQILRLRLEAARSDLLAADGERWLVDLASAAEWLEENFDTSEPAAASLLEALERLRGVDVDPTLPDISEPLHLLRRVMEGSVDAGE